MKRHFVNCVSFDHGAIMAYPDAWIYHFGPEGLQRSDYEETEH
jgi:predicted ATPase